MVQPDFKQAQLVRFAAGYDFHLTVCQILSSPAQPQRSRVFRRADPEKNALNPARYQVTAIFDIMGHFFGTRGPLKFKASYWSASPVASIAVLIATSAQRLDSRASFFAPL